MGRIARFLLSGGVNTALTYLLYLLLVETLRPRVSYTIAFATGVVLAYSLNRSFVFKRHAGWVSVLAAPLIYVAQYGAGLFIVYAWTDWMGWNAAAAPLAAIILTLPLTYLFSCKAFGAR